MTWWYENEEEEMKLYKNEDLCIECKNEFFSKPYDHRDPTPGQLGYCIKCDNCLIKEKKMEFDKSRVFTAVNADELHKGDNVIVADDLDTLKEWIKSGSNSIVSKLTEVQGENHVYRFIAENGKAYSLAYLVERAENCTNCEELGKAGGCCPLDDDDGKTTRCWLYKPKTEKTCTKCRMATKLPDGTLACDVDGYPVDCTPPHDEACSDYKPKKEDNMNWNYKSLPERQENGVSDHVVVAVEGCPYGQSGYYDYDMQAWFVDGCSEPVKVVAWQKIELPKVEKHYRPFKDTDELVKVWDAKYRYAYGLERIDRGLDMPHIWIREKGCDKSADLITCYGSKGITVRGKGMYFDTLFTMFEFLDGTPCGVEE